MTMLRAKNIDKKLSRDEMVQSSAELDFKRLWGSILAEHAAIHWENAAIH